MVTQYALWGQMLMCVHENWTNKNAMQTGYNKYFCDREIPFLVEGVNDVYDHN